MKAPEDEHLMLSTLLERGWTRSMVAALLGDADDTRANPHYKSGPPVRLYRLSRVHEAESTAAFRARAERARARAETARTSAEERRRAILTQVETLRIGVPIFDQDTLVARACAHYNTLWQQRGRDDKMAAPADSPAFLERIAVNYLRHSCTHYEREFARVYGVVGASDARSLIRDRVYKAIARAYPALKVECKRQLRSRDDREFPR